jgi:hypothetical protein
VKASSSWSLQLQAPLPTKLLSWSAKRRLLHRRSLGRPGTVVSDVGQFRGQSGRSELAATV